MKYIILIPMLATVCVSGSLELGEQVLQSTNHPFDCWGYVQHYQAVVLEEELNTAMLIQSITFVSSSTVPYYRYSLDFSVSMAHTDVDQLTEVFENNYPAGSLEEVFFCDSLPLDQDSGEPLVLELDEPFFYSGQGNLLIDIYYPDGYIYNSVWCWEAGSSRSLSRLFAPSGNYYYGLETGILHDDLPYMILEGELALENSTFGSIKVILGSNL